MLEGYIVRKFPRPNLDMLWMKEDEFSSISQNWHELFEAETELLGQDFAPLQANRLRQTNRLRLERIRIRLSQTHYDLGRDHAQNNPTCTKPSHGHSNNYIFECR